MVKLTRDTPATADWPLFYAGFCRDLCRYMCRIPFQHLFTTQHHECTNAALSVVQTPALGSFVLKHFRPALWVYESVSVGVEGTLAICEGHSEDGKFSAKLSFPSNRCSLSNAAWLKRKKNKTKKTFTILVTDSVCCSRRDGIWILVNICCIW